MGLPYCSGRQYKPLRCPSKCLEASENVDDMNNIGRHSVLAYLIWVQQLDV